MSSIHAVFERMIDGRKAVDELRKAGFKAHLDIIDNYKEEYSQEINFAGTRRTPSLSALVLKSDGHLTNVDKGPLSASSPLVSGFGAYREMENTSTRLIVNAEDEKVEEIKNIVKNYGGSL